MKSGIDPWGLEIVITPSGVVIGNFVYPTTLHFDA
jgi:hypothetical protein